MNVSRGSRNNIQPALLNTRNADKSKTMNRMLSKTVLKESTTHNNMPGNEGKVTANKQPAVSKQLSQTVPKAGKPKAIPIRHTLTSKLRMEKANPLLTVRTANESSQIAETPIRRSTFQPGMIHIKQKLDFKFKCPMSESRPILKKNVIKERQSISSRHFKENNSNVAGSHVKTRPLVPNCATIPKITQSQNNTLAKNIRSSVPNKSNCIPMQKKSSSKATEHSTSRLKPQNFNASRAVAPKTVATKRNLPSTASGLGGPNSLSKTSNKTTTKKPQLKSILRSASTGDLLAGNVKREKPTILCGIENIHLDTKVSNKSNKSVAFFSPSLNTTFSTPTISNTPPPSVLRKRLEDWLKKRGKASYNYHHLCCFGLSKNNIPKVDHNEEAPRLDETITLESSDSTVILSQSPNQENANDFGNSVPKGSSTPEQESVDNLEDKENARALGHPEALKDLRKLVYSGYPRDQCEQWLGIISKSHPALKELPQYWECLAALEEVRGDFGSAVDCYGKAIVKGADADDVDQQLDHLWEKFSSLSTSATEKKSTPTRKRTIDTKQIFKSTVIKFALQQKAVKKFSKETGVTIPSVSYIVTPVRRSSRRSQSQFRSTPTITCVDTLDDLQQNIRDAMEFHGNTVLNPGN